MKVSVFKICVNEYDVYKKGWFGCYLYFSNFQLKQNHAKHEILQ